ncbi:hypothetical protein [Pyxidicoccus xibeiensis]|uniref:hypothetical protein n=1 Tax=Pyxidicoccus xibeiensis TaxID=2906759 RepID=UPI0020A76CE9|nr:hypothetical protein [Pyxidicoccus xibeiensis]MCP3144318.1 hypothetical protein [Pyxidicoccus xibeiensis]
MGDSKIQSGNSQLAARLAAEAAARQAAEAAKREAAKQAALQKPASTPRGNTLVKDGFEAPRTQGRLNLTGDTASPATLALPMAFGGGEVRQSRDLPASGPLTPEQATAEVQRLLSSNLIDDVSHDDLMAIEAVLRRVPADQVSQVVANLSDAELEQWVSDLNDPGLLGGGPFRGLNTEERSGLFTFLADNLAASQAARFFTTLDRPEQMVEFGEAFIQRGDVHDRLGFLMSVGQTSFSEGERAASGQVIAAALDSLTSDPGRLAIGVRMLSEQNLQDGLLKAAGVGFNPMGPFGGQLQYTQMDRLQRIVGAVAGTEDHEARAAMFDGMGYVVREMVRGQTPVQDMEAVADQMTGMMTGLLSDDLGSVISHLSGANGLDPTGSALTTYAREQMLDGGGTLGVLAEQMRGRDLHAAGADGRYDNAFLAGYFAGAVLRAVDSLTPADLLGPNAALLDLANLVVSFRTDPATGTLLAAVVSEAERASIGQAMSQGTEAVRNAILDLLGMELSPGNDNGTSLGGFEQGLFAVYGAELYGED